MSWTWFHKLGSPKWFYEISGRWLPWLAWAAVLLVSVGVLESVVPLLPNCPDMLRPQQETEPLSRTAQVWSVPDEMATAVRPLPRLPVSVGVEASLVPPFPNWP